MSAGRLTAGLGSGVGVSAPLGFVIGLSLGALGGGGSILAVPALVYGIGEGAHAATTTSLLAVGATALVGMVGHLRAGRVRVLSGLAFGAVGVGGSLLGSLLSRAVPNGILLLAFSGLMLVAAWRMHARQTETPCHTKQLASVVAGDGEQNQPATGSKRAGSKQTAQARTSTASAVRIVIAGTIVGFLTGFFGVGGGFVIVPALVLALGFQMPTAVGTSLLVIAVSSAEALVFHLSSGGIDWRVAIPFTVAGVIGVLIGDVIAGRVPAARLTKWFVWLLVVVACYTAVRSLLQM